MKHLSQLQIKSIITIFALFLFFLIFAPFIKLLMWAFVIAAILNPLYKYISRFIKSKTIAGMLALGIALIVVIIPFAYLASKVYEEMVITINQLSTIDIKIAMAKLSVYIKNLRIPFTQDIINNLSYGKESLTQLLNGLASDIAGRTVEIAKSTIITVFQVFICLITSFFIVVESKSIKDFVYNISPLNKNDMDMLTSKASATLYATLFGVIAISIIQSLLAGLALHIAGIPHVLFLTALMAVFGTIPFAGTPVVWFPAVVYLFLSGAIIKSVLLFLWGALFVGTIDNVLRPLIIGSKTSLHPMLVFFSIIGGVFLLGPLGIFAGPVMLVIALCLIEIASIH